MTTSYSRCFTQSGNAEHSGAATRANRYRPETPRPSSGTTEMSSEPSTKYLAQIVVSPGLATMNRPGSNTLAIDSRLDDHAATAVTSLVDPSAMLAIALNCATSSPVDKVASPSITTL